MLAKVQINLISDLEIQRMKLYLDVVVFDLPREWNSHLASGFVSLKASVCGGYYAVEES